MQRDEHFKGSTLCTFGPPTSWLDKRANGTKQLYGPHAQPPSSPPLLSFREALAPFLKNEEARLMAESGARRSPFQYILCAATSPAVKQQEESLTYLNQGNDRSCLLTVRAESMDRSPLSVTCNQSSSRTWFMLRWNFKSVSAPPKHWSFKWDQYQNLLKWTPCDQQTHTAGSKHPETQRCQMWSSALDS